MPPARAERRMEGATRLGLLEALYGATHATRARVRAEFEGAGLSVPMFWALHHIVAEGPLTVGQVAVACVVSTANVSTVTDELVEAGFVTRERPKDDRRVVLLSATARGRAVHREVWGRVAGAISRSLAGLSEADLAAATRVLRQVARVAADPPALPELVVP